MVYLGLLGTKNGKPTFTGFAPFVCIVEDYHFVVEDRETSNNLADLYITALTLVENTIIIFTIT